MTDEFDPGRNAEQIKELRDLSGEVLDHIPRLLTGAFVLSIPYLVVEYGPLVASTLTFSQQFENTVTLATTIAVGFVLLLFLFVVGLFVACRGLAWWVERRDARKATQQGGLD